MAHPSRFLTTWAAALLTNFTNAFGTLVDSENLVTLHNLMLDFVNISLDIPEDNKEIQFLLQGVITAYIRVYMGNRMLFWAGRYWEQSHPILSNRIKSKDLVNLDLENGVSELLVHPTRN